MRSSLVALADPFAMLLNPVEVVRAVEHSNRLARLHSRIYRPLDKPLIPRVGKAAQDFDLLIDAAADEA
jgi:hypothetical protein